MGFDYSLYPWTYNIFIGSFQSSLLIIVQQFLWFWCSQGKTRSQDFLFCLLQLLCLNWTFWVAQAHFLPPLLYHISAKSCLHSNEGEDCSGRGGDNLLVQAGGREENDCPLAFNHGKRKQRANKKALSWASWILMSASPPPPNYCCFLWISFFAPLFLSSFSVTHNVNVYPLDVVPIVTVLVTQSCPTLCKTHRCSPPISPVHGILQARILEWVVNSFSRGYSWPRDQTQVSCIAGRFFSIWATGNFPPPPQKTLKLYTFLRFFKTFFFIF